MVLEFLRSPSLVGSELAYEAGEGSNPGAGIYSIILAERCLLLDIGRISLNLFMCRSQLFVAELWMYAGQA